MRRPGRTNGGGGSLAIPRSGTTRKGDAELSATYTLANYETINGSDSTEVLHHCLLPESSSTVRRARLSSRYGQHRRAFPPEEPGGGNVAAHGVTNRLDASISCRSFATTCRYLRTASSWRAGKQSDDALLRPTSRRRTNTRAGRGRIGDVLARAKYRLCPRRASNRRSRRFDSPTGDKEFLGTGATKLKQPSSSPNHRFTRISTRCEYRFGDTDLNLFD
jgi:hypothetical protein